MHTVIFLEENSGTHDDGDSFVWSPFSPPISTAEVAAGLRKQAVLGPLCWSMICMFERLFLDTFAFFKICPTQSDLGRGKPFF